MEVFAPYLKRDFITHTRRVQNLFKRIARNEESWVRDRTDIAFVWATVRAEFEKHRNVRDLRTAKMLLEEGEKKLWLHIHPKPKKHIWSPGGLMFEREPDYPDSHMDLYHPLEKAKYPYYYANREALKKEMLAKWEQDVKGKGEPSTKAH